MSPNDRRFRRTVAIWTAILVAFVFAIQAFGMDIAHSQVLPPQPAPVTDYINYPAPEVSTLAEGCDANDVFGVTFNVNAGPTVTTLADLGPLEAGDVVTMSWTDISPECDPPGTDQSAIVLALKSSTGPTFDPTVDQLLEVPYGLAWMVGGAAGSLSYELPSLTDDSLAGCYFQLDAIVGLPLQIVGPGGSYYNYDRPWDLLIDAVNGAYEACDEPPTTTSTTVPETTTTSTSTTVPDTTTTTTTAPTTTVPTSSPPTVPATNPCYPQGDPATLSPAGANCALAEVGGSGEGADGNPPPPAALPASTALPVTGGSIDLWAAAAILFLCFGWLAHLHTEKRP